MRSSPSSMVTFCLAKAAECRRRAEQTADPTQKRTWLTTEGHWFYLARSYDNERRQEGPDLKVTASIRNTIETHGRHHSEPQAS
jgi:hypothetical protein